MITIMSKEVKVTPMDTVNNARTMPWKVAIEPFRVAPRVWYVAVSYTHLDVYKRQRCRRRT